MQHLISLLHHTKEPHGLFLASLTGASVDITASKKQYEIDVDVPGADVNDVVLELYDDRLSVTTKWPQTETKDANHRTYLVRGRPTGVRKQLFAIPADVLLDKVTAGLDKGVLKVVLPRTEQPFKSLPTAIPVTRSKL